MLVCCSCDPTHTVTMEDRRDVITPLEDGSARASPVCGVSEQPCLGEDRPVSPGSEHDTTG